VPRFEYFLAEALSDVKDGIARGHQHFRVLVDLKTLHDRLEDLVQELGHGLLEKRLVALELSVDCHANKGKAEEARAPIGNVLIILCELFKVENARRHSRVVVVSKAVFDIAFDQIGSAKPFLS